MFQTTNQITSNPIKIIESAKNTPGKPGKPVHLYWGGMELMFITPSRLQKMNVGHGPRRLSQLTRRTRRMVLANTKFSLQTASQQRYKWDQMSATCHVPEEKNQQVPFISCFFLHAWKPSTLPTWQNSISNYKHDQNVRDIFRVYPKFIRINIQTLKHCSLMSLQPWNGCICDLSPYLHQAQCLGSTHKSQTNPSNSLTF